MFFMILGKQQQDSNPSDEKGIWKLRDAMMAIQAASGS